MPEPSSFPPFTHLHVHSSYSVSEGLSTPAEICAFAHLAGYGSVALTDTDGTFGFMELHYEAKKLGLKPIYGSVIHHASLCGEQDGRYRIGLIALSRTGLRNLCVLTSLSVQRLDEDEAVTLGELEQYREGLIFLCGGRGSEIAHCVRTGKQEQAVEAIARLQESLRERLFIEIQDHGEPEEQHLIQGLLELIENLPVEPVLTNDVCYVGREKHRVIGILSDIGPKLSETDLFLSGSKTRNRGMRTRGEMAPLHNRYRRAFENTYYIDAMIEGDLLDEFAFSDGVSPLDHLLRTPDDPERLLIDKVWRRFNLYFHYLDRADIRYYKGILEAELHQIITQGLTRPFLLFHEIISALKGDKVWLGPATGLNVQSLCAYLLNITSFNPYADDFAFKPILNRTSIHHGTLEIQIATEDRGVVLRSLRTLFDAKYLAYVPGVDHLTPLRALKAASKQVEIDEEELGEILKIAIQNPGMSLMKLCEGSKPLGSKFKRSARVRELIQNAALLEGHPTGFIRSKRSIIVSPTPVKEFAGVFTDKKGGDRFLQATKEAFPFGNIVRLDFTLLGSLSVCMKTERELRKQRRKIYTWDTLPRDDEAVWNDIATGESLGVYMIENSNINNLCTAFGPQSIEDLIDFLALLRFRPDAKSFKNRLEQYRSQKLPDCDYKPELMVVLGRMHGILLYEEQLRDIISILTGLETARAYQLLQEFKSEDPGILSKLRKEFMRRSANEDIPFEEATKWFEKIHHYSTRTVSRQRILADALLIYKMFYLKRYHSSHFYLSLLNTYWDNEAKVKMYLAYFHERDLLLPVDINRSELYFTLEEERIRLGLHMIEGLSYPLLLKILNTRSRRRRFKSLEDFMKRMQGRGLTIEDIGKLVMAGAFDFTGISRTNMMNALPELYEEPGAVSTRGLKNQLELPFDLEPRGGPVHNGSDLMDKILNQKSSVNREVDLRKEHAVISVLEDFYTLKSASLVEIAGQVSNMQRLKTASGKILGFFVLFDFSAFVHVFIPWDRFSQFEVHLEEGKKVIVRGRVSVRDDKKVCEAIAIKAFSEGAAQDDNEGSDEPSERHP